MSPHRKPTYVERTIKAVWHLHLHSKRPAHVKTIHAYVRKNAETAGDALGPRHTSFVTRALKTLTDAELIELTTTAASSTTTCRRSSIGSTPTHTHHGYVFTDAGKKYIAATKKKLTVNMEDVEDETRLWQAVARHFTTIAALQGHPEDDEEEEEEITVPTSTYRRRSSLAVPARSQSQPTRRSRASLPNMSASRAAAPRTRRRSSIVTAPTGRTPVKQTPAKSAKRKRLASLTEDSDESELEVTPRPKKRVADMKVAKLPRDKLQLIRAREELSERARKIEEETKKLDDLELEMAGSDDGVELPSSVPAVGVGATPEYEGGALSDMDPGMADIDMDWPDDVTEIQTQAATTNKPSREVQSTHSGLHTPPNTSPPEPDQPQFSPPPTAPLESHLEELEEILGTTAEPEDDLTTEERRERNVTDVKRCVDIVGSMEKVITSLRAFSKDPEHAEVPDTQVDDYYEQAATDCVRVLSAKFRERLAETDEVSAEKVGD